MDSNEEYLDQLLKSLTGEGSSEVTGGAADLEQDDGLGDLLNQFSDDMDNVPGDLLSGLLGGSDNPLEELSDTGQEEALEAEPMSLSGMLQDMTEEEEAQRDLEAAEDSYMEMPSEESIEEIDIQQPVFEESEQVAFEVPEIPDSEVIKETVAEMDEPFPEEMEGDDLGSLLESLGADGDEDVQEISELLDKADRDEPIDDMVDSLMQGMPQDEMYPEEDFSSDSTTEELLDGPKKKKKKEKKERVKKEKKPRRSKKKQEVEEPADDSPKETDDLSEEDIAALLQEAGDALPDEPVEEEKKQGFWGKLLNALTQEEEEEEDPADLVSDENGEILKELEKEKKQAKGKKKKKGKDKKAAETDEDEDLEEDSDNKKKKKEKKPKKEKPPVPVEEAIPGKKLSMKKVVPLVAVLLVFCLAYVMVSHLYINHANKQQAEKAYYAGEYLECYSLLLGQELNGNQELMFHRSELVLQMERMKGNYRSLLMEGNELEALDYLVQCICRRQDTYLLGQEWNSLDVVEEAYAGMLGLLAANYGLTEEQALEIAALKKDVDYTLALLEVLEGIGARASDEEASQQEQPVSYEDLLPEEKEDADTTFVDTLGD